MSDTATQTNREQTFHDTPRDTYDRLVELFGELQRNDTRWVTIGAGQYSLTFFAPREKTA